MTEAAGIHCDPVQYLQLSSSSGLRYPRDPFSLLSNKKKLIPQPSSLEPWYRSAPFVLTYTGFPRHHLSVLVNNPRYDGYIFATAPKAVNVHCPGIGGRGPWVIDRPLSFFQFSPSPRLLVLVEYHHQSPVHGVLLGLLLYIQPFLPGVGPTCHLSSFKG